MCWLDYATVEKNTEITSNASCKIAYDGHLFLLTIRQVTVKQEDSWYLTNSENVSKILSLTETELPSFSKSYKYGLQFFCTGKERIDVVSMALYVALYDLKIAALRSRVTCGVEVVERDEGVVDVKVRYVPLFVVFKTDPVRLVEFEYDLETSSVLIVLGFNSENENVCMEKTGRGVFKKEVLSKVVLEAKEEVGRLFSRVKKSLVF